MPSTLEQIETLLRDVNTRLQAMPEQLSEEKIKAIVAEILAAESEKPEFQRKMRFSGEPKLAGSKFARWGLSVADVEWLHDLQTSLIGQRRVSGGVYHGPSEDLDNAWKAISQASYMSEEEVRRMDIRALDDLFPRIPLSQFHGLDRQLAARGRWEETQAYRRAMDSAESGYGSQLVGAQYVGELWEVARLESRIMSLLDTFEMTAPTAYLPVEVDMPELLFVAENTDNNSANYTTVKTGSQRVTVTAKKFVIHQMWSGEMEEDSIIPFVPFLRRQAQMGLGHYSDSLALNGDTTNTDTGNINLDDANPADTKHYLAFDGLRHAGLVDNTNNRKDIAAAITTDDFVDALERLHDVTRMVHWGLPTRMEDVVYIMDSATYLTLRKDPDVLTLDKMGPKATILTGQLAALHGHPIIVSEAMSKTEADGKVSTTAGNNTKGQILTFNRRGFKWGWRRRVKLETERIPATDQTRLVYSLRAGFGRFTPTGNDNAIEAADVMYDITV